MKILIVCQYFWPENFRVNDLALGLQDRGHDVDVLTGIPNYPGGRYFDGYGLFKRRTEVFEGISVYRVPQVPRGKSRSIGLVLNYLSFACGASLYAFLRRWSGFDCIVVYQLSPVIMALPAVLLRKLYGTPMIMYVQDLWPESLSAVKAIESKRTLDAVERLVSFIYGSCDRILVQSLSFVQSIQQRCSHAVPIEYLPNSTEEYYQPVTLENEAAERSLVPVGFVVMFAGNIGVAQDFPTILQAAGMTRHLTEIRWVIVGDGRQREWLAEEIRRRGLDECVHLVGRYPAEQMPRFFSLADVLLMTLRREPIFALTIPSKLQSYLACARPVVAALDGEGARIVEEAGAGLTCPAESPLELASRVVEMYRMPTAERNAMGQRGRDYFDRHFDRNMLIGRLEGWLDDTVKEKAKR